MARQAERGRQPQDISIASLAAEIVELDGTHLSVLPLPGVHSDTRRRSK